MDAETISSIASPPAWALNLGSVGRAIIVFSALCYGLSVMAGLLGKSNVRFRKAGEYSFALGCIGLALAFCNLAVLFANNRFEFEYVYNHADTHNALAYRIAGIWSGQQGSFLLWGVCSAIFGFVTAPKTRQYRRWYTIVYAFFLGGIASILAFESPFRLNEVNGIPFTPAEGMGLAPSLQNYWVIIHPPTIFLGFGSLTALFALASAATIQKDLDGWVPIVRPWAILSTTLVGLGLCMGGFWAYETLGWGGFWMWDPVENTSFVPWCFSAALLHGLILQQTKKRWQIANLFLGALPFLAFMYGTFLTRSGFLSDASVHSFAEMDRSALKLLIFLMGATTIGFLGVWFTRLFQAKDIAAPKAEKLPFSREWFYVLGVSALITLGMATCIGMSVPFVQALKGEKPRVVEEGLYHQVLPYVFIPITLLLAIAPFSPWNGIKPKELFGKAYTPFCITVGLTGTILFATIISPMKALVDLEPVIKLFGNHEAKGLVWITFLFSLCMFAIVTNVAFIIRLFKRSKLGTMSFLSHVGVGILMAGLIISRGFERKGEGMVMENKPGHILNYEVRYAGMTTNDTDRNNHLLLRVYDAHKPGGPIYTASPGLYKVTMADGQTSTMVWPDIRRGLLMDTYLSIGQPATGLGMDVSIKPGETVDASGLRLTYKLATRTGEMGVPGTRFGAEVSVNNGSETINVHPEMELGNGEVIPHPARLDNQMELRMNGMNAKDKSVNLRLQLTTPVYPVQIYHKPLTILVWIGTGVMTLAGLLSAFYRRFRQPSTMSSQESNE